MLLNSVGGNKMGDERIFESVLWRSRYNEIMENSRVAKRVYEGSVQKVLQQGSSGNGNGGLIQ